MNETRLVRKRKEGTWDRATLRHLRHKFGKDKKSFLLLRGVYLALCEIIEDFNDKPIMFFTKTVGSYAGCDRHTAGKYLTTLEEEGLLIKHQHRDSVTKKFFGGTVIEVQDITEYVPYQSEEEKRGAVGKVSRRRGNPPSISDSINVTYKNTVDQFKEEIKNITQWAYQRAEVPPNCSKESFEHAVVKAIARVGYPVVKRYFSYEVNAIAFLVNLKNA